MSPKGTKKNNGETISPAEFPSLRSFLRGYFHQEMAYEYGSIEEAVRQFCEDADQNEREAVASEWSRFAAHTRGWSLADINRALTGQLGSAILLQPEDLETISRVFGEFKRR